MVPENVHPQAVTDGVKAAVLDWIFWRDVTAVDCLHEGIKAAMANWLDAHESEIIAAIADRVVATGGNE